MNDGRFDERILRFVIVVAAIAFLGILLLPPTYATRDEAKYIGLGLNILDGRGLVTAFGGLFLNHSPAWPLVMVVPQRLAGIDALTVGHVLNALAGSATIVLAAALAWRVRPVAGAVTALVLLAFPFLASNARTAGLDLPATALTLAYLLIGLRALDRGSVRLGFGAGIVFGAAFLVKETALPFLPVPFLVAFLADTEVRRIGRIAAATLVAAAVTMSWWFVLHAALGGTVYRLGTPAWTLGPLAVVGALAVVVLWFLGWIEDRTNAGQRVAARVPAARAWWRPVVAWLGLGAWFLGQLALYARTPKLVGESLIRVSQLSEDVRVYAPTVAVVAGFVAVGGLIALLLIRRSQGVRELLFATVAGAPLVLLVLAIGETPRHYLANIAILVALAAAGWVHAADRARADRRWIAVVVGGIVVAGAVALRVKPVTVRGAVAVAVVLAILALIVLVWGWRRARPDGGGGAGAAARAPYVATALLVTAALVVFVTAGAVKSVASDRTREAAVDVLGSWIEANVPAGEGIVVSPAFAYELSVKVRDHPFSRIRPGVGVVKPVEPFGLSWYGRSAIMQPLAIHTALRNVDQLDVYGADALDAALRDAHPAVWIHGDFVTKGVRETSTSAMLASIKGLTPLEDWVFPGPDGDYLVTAYGVDLEALDFPTSPVYADATTLKALVRLFRAEHAGPEAAALAERLQVFPDDPRGAALIAELKAIGAANGAP